METRLYNILKITNATKFIKTILENAYKVVLGTYHLATPTWPIYLLRVVKFQATFGILINIIFAIS